MATKTAICKTAWQFAPLLVEGAEYDLLSSFWENGEGHFNVRNADGVVFDAPDVFFVYDEAHYD